MQELTDVVGIKKFWVVANSAAEIRVWFSHPSQAIEECAVINRVKHRGFVSIREKGEEWKIDYMYSTIRKKDKGMSGLGCLTESARSKVIDACEYVISDWIPRNGDEIEEARIETFRNDVRRLEADKAALQQKLAKIDQEIADKTKAIDDHENGNAIAEITLSRAEGTIAEVDQPATVVKSWEEANKVISKWAETVKSGTNKVDCWISWKNGEKYSYILNLGKHHKNNPDFRQVVLSSIQINTGDHCPAHITNEEYGRFTSTYLKPETRDRFRKLLSFFSQP